MAKETATKMTPKPAFGSLVHFELYSSAPDKTQRFFETVFGWTFAATPGMDYTHANLPQAPNGGLMPRTPETKDVPGVLNYISVDSVDRVSKAIAKAGGKILMPKYEVPKVGWFALFQDPGGSVLAVWQKNP